MQLSSSCLTVYHNISLLQLSAPKPKPPWCGGAAVASSSTTETSTVTLTIMLSVLVTNRVTNVYQNTTTFITEVQSQFSLVIVCGYSVMPGCLVTVT